MSTKFNNIIDQRQLMCLINASLLYCFEGEEVVQIPESMIFMRALTLIKVDGYCGRGGSVPRYSIGSRYAITEFPPKIYDHWFVCNGALYDIEKYDLLFKSLGQDRLPG